MQPSDEGWAGGVMRRETKQNSDVAVGVTITRITQVIQYDG